jgi:hypothetical protein
VVRPQFSGTPKERRGLFEAQGENYLVNRRLKTIRQPRVEEVINRGSLKPGLNSAQENSTQTRYTLNVDWGTGISRQRAWFPLVWTTDQMSRTWA